MKLAINGAPAVRTEPFPQWPIHNDAERDALLEVLESRWWGTLGPKAEAFEKAFSAYIGVSYAQSVFNGTVSLEAILRALGIGFGDEVIVPPYTFVATVTSVLAVGATPIFADIDPRTNCIDPKRAEEAITERTKAIIPVHISGTPADMDAIDEIARRHGLAVVEDAAQAHGSEWRSKRVGSLGNAGSFSFQLSKNMTAGEGGAITTNDAKLYEACWSVHHCGRKRGGAWYEHERIGSNFRMTEWQAAVLLAQLDRLEGQTAKREESAAYLDSLLARIPGISLFERDQRVTRHSHHLYMFRFSRGEFKDIEKSSFVAALNAEGIPAGAGYVELQKQPLFEDPLVRRILTRPIDYASLELPEAARACAETVWIPQNALLATRPELEDIAEAVSKIQRNAGEIQSS